VRDITAPTGSGSVPSSSNEDVAVSLSAAGVSDNDPAFGSNRRDYWTFTDGTARNLSGASQSYTFATPGTFTITLLTMDLAGNRFTATFTITIADVTPPVPTIGGTSLGQSRQQFSSMTHTGTATDNVAVTAYGWDFVENSLPVAVSGATMTRSWAYTGVYTLTFWARDAAGNNGTSTTTFTVTADVTPPTVSITSGPTLGDDQTALTYTATASDNNPNCATLCTYEWQVDGVQVSTGSLTLVTTLTAGRHAVSFRATDPALNVGSATRTVDVDQLILVDTTWSGVTTVLNWNVRVTNGVTLYIVNSTIMNSSNAINTGISVTWGRVVIENSQFTSTSLTNGFILSAVRAATPASAFATVLINSSTVSGLMDWYRVTRGTFSIRDSTMSNLRGASTGAVYGIDSDLYFTNTAITATTITTTNGIRAEWTSALTVLETRELVLQNVQINSSVTPVRTYATQSTGTINIVIRDTTLLSTSTSSTTRAIDQLFLSTTAAVNNTFQNVNVQAVRGGGLYAVYQVYGGTVVYTIADSNFSGSLSGNGTTIQLVDSNARFSYTFYNHVATENSLSGAAFRFVNNTANIGSWNQGDISVSFASLFNNTLDGLLFEQANSRLTATIDIMGSMFAANRRHGINADTRTGNITALWWTLDSNYLINNRLNGFQYTWALQRVNVSMDITNTVIESNLLAGMNISLGQGNSFEGATRGAFIMNFTDSMARFNGNGSAATTGGSGIATYETSANSNNQIFMNFLRAQLVGNRKHGLEMITYYASQSYVHRGTWYMPFSDRYVTFEDSLVSYNNGNGVFTSAQYCAYGTTNSTFPSSCLFSFTFSRTHVDWNNDRGMRMNFQYGGYYASSPVYINTANDTTFDNNGAQGLMEDHYYTYMYNVVAGRPSDTVYNLVNTSFSYNGRLNSGEGHGIFARFYYDYYLTGSRSLNTDNASFIGNRNSGFRLYVYYGYYNNPIYRPNIFNSTFIDNDGAGWDPYYYYTYQCGNCVQENIEQNLMVRNQLGAIRAGIPESAGRYFSAYTMKYVNNVIDETPTTAISSYVTYSYTTYYYSGNNILNISGNRITNTTGAAISFYLDAPQTGGTVTVDFSNNWIETSSDTSGLRLPGSVSVSHQWTVNGNTFKNTSNSALILNMPNYGSGNTGGLSFTGNTFIDTAGTAFSIVQSNIAMTALSIKDDTFINSQIGLDLTGINGVVTNATFQGSIKADIQLTNGALEIHRTAVDPDMLVPIGGGSFSVFFSLKIYVVWSGSLRPATGSIVELADALGTTFFVGSVLGADGLPEFESLSYTKNTQGVLGRSPFRATVNYFELTQSETIPLPSDRVVSILLRDDVPPTMVLASPASGFATRGDTIEVEGTAYDSHSGFTYDQNDSAVAAQFVQISTDETNWVTPEIIQASTGEIAFRTTLTGLDESVRNVYVRIHDEAGNYYTRIVPVVLDRTPPVVTLLQEVPAITRADSVLIVAETEVGASVFVNGIAPAEILTRPDGIHAFFSMEVAIIEGPNTITVMAMDALRNQGRLTVAVTADREAPYLVIISPEQDALVRGTDVQVKGHTADRSAVTVTVNGQAAALDADGNFSVPVPIAGDVTRIETIAVDGAGNQVILVRVVRFDEVPPWVTVENPPEGTLVGTTEVVVSGVVEQGALLVINGETVDAPRGVFSRRILLVEGENTVIVEATDSAGNKAVLNRAVTVDTRSPTIQVSSIADGTLWAHPNVILIGRASDDHAVALTLNGEEVDVLQGDFSADVALLEGTNVLHLIATDAAGNVARLDIRVVRDTTAPVVAPLVEGLRPDAGQYYTTEPAVSVSGIAEPGTIVEVCYTQEIGGRECNVVPVAGDGSFRTYVDLVKNSKNSITVVGTDAAGNVATRELQVSQSEALVVAPQAPVVAYGAAAMALALLGLGGYFLMMSRRSRGQAEELAGADPYAAPAPLEASLAPQLDVAPAPPPPVETPTISTVPSDEQLVEAAPESKPKMRPMRRRPAAPGGEGADALTDKGTSAEGEAGPSENQAESKKEGDQ
jgi:hypothetical protein